MKERVTLVIAIIVFFLGIIIGLGIAYETDYKADKVLETLESYSHYCKINNMGEVESFDSDSFTCTSYNITVPSHLALGANFQNNLKN